MCFRMSTCLNPISCVKNHPIPENIFVKQPRHKSDNDSNIVIFSLALSMYLLNFLNCSNSLDTSSCAKSPSGNSARPLRSG